MNTPKFKGYCAPGFRESVARRKPQQAALLDNVVEWQEQAWMVKDTAMVIGPNGPALIDERQMTQHDREVENLRFMFAEKLRQV